MTDSQPKLKDLVKAGATFLDKKRPGWYHKVATKTLDMGDEHNCIVAQVTGFEFTVGLRNLGVDTFTDTDDVELGFELDSEQYIGSIADEQRDYAKLTRLWLKQIDKRRQAYLQEPESDDETTAVSSRALGDVLAKIMLGWQEDAQSLNASNSEFARYTRSTLNRCVSDLSLAIINAAEETKA